jgi:enterochelin esterase-like enzyme
MDRIFFLFLLVPTLFSCDPKERENVGKADIISWTKGELQLSELELDSFFKTNASPLILYGRAYFFYKGNAKKLLICGDFNQWSLDSIHSMKSLDKGYWSIDLPFDPKAQLEYKFVLNGEEWILDPLNPNTSIGGFGENSLLRMSEYSPQWELLEESESIDFQKTDYLFPSDNLDTIIRVDLLRPRKQGELIKGRLPIVFFQDGKDYLELGSFEKAIGNLIEKETIEPFLGVFVSPHNRNNLYAGDMTGQYSRFFAEELLPKILEENEVDNDPSRRIVVGASYGANISALICFQYPTLFPNCAMQSPAFLANDNEVFKLFSNSEKVDLKLSYIWGSYEFLNDEIKRFSKLASLKGYEQFFKVYPEGHNWIFWAGTYDDLLIPFIPGKKSQQ